MARRFTYGATFRSQLRKSRRLQIQQGQGGFTVYLGTNPSTGTVVRSVLTLLNYMTPKQKAVMREARKVQKRIEELEAQGWTFPKGGIIDDIKNGNFKLNKKTLEKLQDMDKRWLRQHAASYGGETDINKILDKYNKEVAEKRRASIEAKKRAQKEAQEREQYEGRSIEDIQEDEIPEDWDVKIHNIIEEEQAYINECLFFLYGFGKDNERMNDLVNEAVSLARSVIETVMNITEEEARVIIDYWESPGMINRIINDAETRFKGLFYDVPYFNEHVLGLFPGGSQIAFNRKFSEGDFEPASQYDFFNDVEDEDEY